MKRSKLNSATGRHRVALARRALIEEVAFERAMRDMATDPEIQAECKAIQREFARFELDGLGAAESTPPLRRSTPPACA
jgi:hypothetical protein